MIASGKKNNHFGHKSELQISITLGINQFVRRTIVTVIINLQHIGHKLPGYASKTHV